MDGRKDVLFVDDERVKGLHITGLNKVVNAGKGEVCTCNTGDEDDQSLLLMHHDDSTQHCHEGHDGNAINNIINYLYIDDVFFHVVLSSL